MMTKVSLILFIFFCFSCDEKKSCISGEYLERRFKSAIKVVENCENLPVNHGQYAMLYLEAFTQIPNSTSYFTFAEYKNKQDKNKDLKAWKNWLEKNKCKYTFIQMDSILRQNIPKWWLEMPDKPF